MLSLNPTFTNNYSVDDRTSHLAESPWGLQDIVSVQTSCSMLAHNQSSEKGSMKEIPKQHIPSLMNSNQCNMNMGAGT